VVRDAGHAAVKGKVFKGVVINTFGPTGIRGGSYTANDMAQDIK
jgi:hypothetical protein